VSASPRAVRLTPDLRFRDLHAAGIVNLPTPSRRLASLGRAGLCAFCTFLGIAGAVTLRPLMGLVALMFALAACGYVQDARRIAAQLEMPGTASEESLGEPSESGEEVANGAMSLALSGASGLLDIGVGLATRYTDRFRRWRGVRRYLRWRETTPIPPGELHLVTCRATQRLHWPWRLLLPLTLYLAGLVLWRPGWLTITDRQFRYRRLSVPLEEVEVVEWFKGAFGEAHEQVLLVRAGGRTLRLCIDKIWAAEAQCVFEILACRSARPPAFLAARWSLHP
jgi:hypothetical protein